MDIEAAIKALLREERIAREERERERRMDVARAQRERTLRLESAANLPEPLTAALGATVVFDDDEAEGRIEFAYRERVYRVYLKKNEAYDRGSRFILFCYRAADLTAAERDGEYELRPADESHKHVEGSKGSLADDLLRFIGRCEGITE